LKKLKSDSAVIDGSVIIVPDCVFLRGHYDSNEQLPKSILAKWAKSQGFSSLPSYSNEIVDKRFRSSVKIGGKNFRTDGWERNKKHAEQAAALACIRFMKLTS
jgi:dsRNA-specific ribonuclease